MNPWIIAANDLADAWAVALWRASWQGGLAVLVVWAVCGAFARTPPAVQCWLWRLVHLKLLVALVWAAPIVLPLLPARPTAVVADAEWNSATVSMLPSLAQRAAGADQSPLQDDPTFAPPDTSSPASAAALSLNPNSPHRASLATMGLAVWLLGAGCCVAKVLRRYRDVRRIRRTSNPAVDHRLAEAVAALSSQAGLRRPPELLVADLTGGPRLIGVVRPALLLPRALLHDLTPLELRMLLAHELAHLARRDLLWNWLPVASQVLFFFHPLVWLARRRLRLCQEMACDRAALNSSQGAVSEYRRLLVKLAAQCRACPSASELAVAASESYAGLRWRLCAMKNSNSLSLRRGVALAVLVAVAGLLGILPWRVGAQTPPEEPARPTAAVPDEQPGGVAADRAAAGPVPPASNEKTAKEAEPSVPRWVYAQPNLQEDAEVQQVIELLARMAQSGYNGLVLADYRFNLLDQMPPEYRKNVARVRDAAATAQIEIIPAIFPVGGYSGGLLANDPNLAEGLPVKAAPYVVAGGKAVLVPDPEAELSNGDFEESSGDYFPGFDLQDDPGKSTFADRQVFRHGGIACRMQDFTENDKFDRCRLHQRVQVRPFACYRLSCWVKTDEFQSDYGFQLLALRPGTAAMYFKDSQAAFSDVFTQATADWTQVNVLFNSLDQTELEIYAGVWHGRAGRLWIDDLKLEEVSLTNLLRRDGCPLVVASADGRTTYDEGRDFEPLADPLFGADPYPGRYDVYHPGPDLRLTANSRINEGDRLQVSWYHAVSMGDPRTTCCLSDPKLFALLLDQARRINELFQPKTILLSHGVVRVANWCQTCQALHTSPGGLLAENLRRSIAILKETSPQARLAVWSNAFDPHHNARERFYLANGSLQGSWEGLPSDVLVVNQNTERPEASLNWFAGRGHRQIISAYEDQAEPEFDDWDAAAQGLPTDVGFLYTTWRKQYDHLERYAGRWQPRDE